MTRSKFELHLIFKQKTKEQLLISTLIKDLKCKMHARNEQMSRRTDQSTSFSFIADTLKEFGEEDLFDADNELLVEVFCLGIIL